MPPEGGDHCGGRERGVRDLLELWSWVAAYRADLAANARLSQELLAELTQSAASDTELAEAVAVSTFAGAGAQRRASDADVQYRTALHLVDDCLAPRVDEERRTKPPIDVVNLAFGANAAASVADAAALIRQRREAGLDEHPLPCDETTKSLVLGWATHYVYLWLSPRAVQLYDEAHRDHYRRALVYTARASAMWNGQQDLSGWPTAFAARFDDHAVRDHTLAKRGPTWLPV